MMQNKLAILDDDKKALLSTLRKHITESLNTGRTFFSRMVIFLSSEKIIKCIGALLQYIPYI